MRSILVRLADDATIVRLPDEGGRIVPPGIPVPVLKTPFVTRRIADGSLVEVTEEKKKPRRTPRAAPLDEIAGDPAE
jgi:hypothetical protein